MACNFTINFTGSADEVVANVKSKVLANNGTFNGDSNSGSFSVPVPTSHIDGSYTINSQQMTVDISHKPFFLGCGVIQSYVEDNLGKTSGQSV